MKDVRVVPISSDSASIQVTCDCGNSAMKQAGRDKEFVYFVAINDPKFGDFVLTCICGKEFHIVNQRTHFYIREKSS